MCGRLITLWFSCDIVHSTKRALIYTVRETAVFRMARIYVIRTLHRIKITFKIIIYIVERKKQFSLERLVPLVERT